MQRTPNESDQVKSACVAFGFIRAGIVWQSIETWGQPVFEGTPDFWRVLTNAVWLIVATMMLRALWKYSEYSFRHLIVALMFANICYDTWLRVSGGTQVYGWLTFVVSTSWLVGLALLYFAPQRPSELRAVEPKAD